jgi:hypothetical protein
MRTAVYFYIQHWITLFQLIFSMFSELSHNDDQNTLDDKSPHRHGAFSAYTTGVSYPAGQKVRFTTNPAQW